MRRIAAQWAFAPSVPFSAQCRGKAEKLTTEQRRRAAVEALDPDFEFLSHCEPLLRPLGETQHAKPLISWECFGALGRMQFEDQEALDAGKKAISSLSPEFRSHYNFELDLAESLYPKLLNLRESVAMAQDSGSDPELISLAKEEVVEAGENLIDQFSDSVSKGVRRILSRLDSVGSTSSMWTVEVEGRAGGGEASIFAAELYQLYRTEARKRGWKVEEMKDEEAGITGSKMKVIGDDVYRSLKWEIGTHRVQRIPETEQSGRLQTSTASVYLMPIPDPISVNVQRDDCDIQMVRGGGPGGQGVNSSSNCCVMHHLPSGLRARSHRSRSGAENVNNCLQEIAQKIWVKSLTAAQKEKDNIFGSQFESGERANRIRTYNLPQNRVSEHRTKTDYFYNTFLIDPAQLMSLQDDLAEREEAAQTAQALRRVIDEKFPLDR